MKKFILFLCVIFTAHYTSANTLKELSENKLKDIGHYNFVLQFKGYNSYEAIKHKQYEVDYWVSLAESDDPLAAYILSEYYAQNGEVDKAIHYTGITFVQTDEKISPAGVLLSLYDAKYGQPNIHKAALIKILSVDNPLILSHKPYKELLDNFDKKSLARIVRAKEKWFEKLSKNYGNHYVKYGLDYKDVY